MPVFFSEGDYHSYIALLTVQAECHALEIWSYCLMPNHVHLIAVPAEVDGLARPIGEAHRRYAELINRRHEWTGHLWQERFASAPMDEAHLMAAVRYILLNPVRAGLVDDGTSWPFSSARAQVERTPDKLVNPTPMASRVPNWHSYLSQQDDAATEDIRNLGTVGRPLGSRSFVSRLEQTTGRRLRPHPVGRKRLEK